MQFVFAGSNDFAASHLKALVDAGYVPCVVLTQQDRRQGRGQRTQPNPVKYLAQQLDLAVWTPETMTQEVGEQLTELDLDLMIVVAYGHILPQAILDIPRHGCVNVHGSLLPRHRGASPIQSAILAGDTQTGVTLMAMDAGCDTGPMIASQSYTLTSDETSASLSEALALIGQQLLLDFMNQLQHQGFPELIPQDATQATHTQKIRKQDAAIDWHLPAEVIERMIRAYNPWPICHFTIDGEYCRVLSAHLTPGSDTPGALSIDSQGLKIATGTTLITLTAIQCAGKRVWSQGEWLQARPQWQALTYLEGPAL